MKTLLPIAAVLSFLFPFVCGVWLLNAALPLKSEAGAFIRIAIGSFLVLSAFFVGAILVFAAGEFDRSEGAAWSWD